jgi:signal transduction histidine kinase
MQERVQALGGSYKVDSGAGSGTCVRIVIPLQGRQDGCDDSIKSP